MTGYFKICTCCSHLHSSIFSIKMQSRKGDLVVNISKIDEFCKLHGISRTKLEMAVGLGNGAIGKWEKSVNGPSIKQLKKVADYFRVPVDALLVNENGENGNE